MITLASCNAYMKDINRLWYTLRLCCYVSRRNNCIHADTNTPHTYADSFVLEEMHTHTHYVISANMHTLT